MTGTRKTRTYTTARDAYAINLARAKESLARLQQEIEKDARAFESDYLNWGYVGSMAHVHAEIESIATFLAGEPR